MGGLLRDGPTVHTATCLGPLFYRGPRGRPDLDPKADPSPLYHLEPLSPFVTEGTGPLCLSRFFMICKRQKPVSDLLRQEMNYLRPDPGRLHRKGRLRGHRDCAPALSALLLLLVHLITGAPSGGGLGDTIWSLRGRPRGGLTGRHNLPPVGSARPPQNRRRSGEGLRSVRGLLRPAELCPPQTRPSKPELSLPQNVTSLGDGAFKEATQLVGSAGPSRLSPERPAMVVVVLSRAPCPLRHRLVREEEVRGCPGGVGGVGALAGSAVWGGSLWGPPALTP